MRPQTNGQPLKRFTRGSACPVCGGCQDDPRGQGKRCFGFVSGDWIHCTREDHSPGCRYHPDSESYSHRLHGKCRCGVEHNPAPDLPNGNGKHRAKNRRRVDYDHPVACYTYEDADRKPRLQVRRLNVLDEHGRIVDKTFRQYRPDGKGGWQSGVNGIEPVLYRLPELIAANPSQPVWICEGEKDANNLRAMGQIATTNPMGAGKWKRHYAEDLRGRVCRISPHNDKTGREHAQDVAKSLSGKAASVKIVELPGLPERGDVSDFLEAGGTVEQIEKLAEQAPEWKAVNAPDWAAEQPILDRNGEWKSCAYNAQLWLARHKDEYQIRFNRLSQRVVVNGKVLTDAIEIRAKIKIEADLRSTWSTSYVREALINLAIEETFNPLTDWLHSLVWDGTARIDAFFQRVWGYNEKDAEYATVCARVLFLSAVARAYKPGAKADALVVLQGSQGTKKSTAIKSLCPPEMPELFAEDLGCDLDSDKVGNSLCGKWLIELGEFNRINRGTIESVKQFLSRTYDHFKFPYDRNFVDQPRSCTFVGSTNNREPLIDEENRRFLPIWITEVADLDWIEQNRDQLWAEAVHRYRNGEPWWVDVPTGSDADPVGIEHIVAERQEAARCGDDYDGVLAEALDGQPFAKLDDVLSPLNLTMDRYDARAQSRIGKSLVRIGFVRDKSPGWRQRSPLWIKNGT